MCFAEYVADSANATAGPRSLAQHPLFIQTARCSVFVASHSKFLAQCAAPWVPATQQSTILYRPNNRTVTHRRCFARAGATTILRGSSPDTYHWARLCVPGSANLCPPSRSKDFESAKSGNVRHQIPREWDFPVVQPVNSQMDLQSRVAIHFQERPLRRCA